MLLKLQPLQIDRYWSLVKQVIEGSLPPGTIPPEREHYFMQSLMRDIGQVWVIPGGRTGDKVRAMLITTAYTDDITQTKDLLVYAAYSFYLVPEEIWEMVEKDLVAVAKASGCHRIVTFTDEERVIELMTKFGYDGSYRFMVKEV